MVVASKMSISAASTQGTAKWECVYARLQLNREDVLAWRLLDSYIRRQAKRDLEQYGWRIVENVVHDTSAGVAAAFHRAHGPHTFRGFVLGHYWNARRQALAALWTHRQ
jgi:hypothetical protein